MNAPKKPSNSKDKPPGIRAFEKAKMRGYDDDVAILLAMQADRKANRDFLSVEEGAFLAARMEGWNPLQAARIAEITRQNLIENYLPRRKKTI